MRSLMKAILVGVEVSDCTDHKHPMKQTCLTLWLSGSGAEGKEKN